MRRIYALFLSVFLFFTTVIPVSAQKSKVLYDGNAKQFIFAPGSDQFPTDLFSEFKDVMPGDTLSQRITLRNEAAKNVKVKLYLRALGAHPQSKEFLSQLRLRVGKHGQNTYLFDAAAHETAQLTDWVCLGTLYSGGELELEVCLSVPVELNNDFQEQVGYLDWEFMVEEFPVEDTDPQPPKTGDDFPVLLWAILLAASSVALFVLLPVKKKKKEQDD